MKICKGCKQEFNTGRKNTKVCEKCRCENGKFLCRYICMQCNVEKCEPKYKKPKFCSLTCKNKWEHANGVRKVGFDPHKGCQAYWKERLSEEEAYQKIQEHRQKLSDGVRNADMTLQKKRASEIISARNRSYKGLTLEQIYGEEKARTIREKLSTSCRGERNPAFGKVYTNCGKSVKGYYKGHFFRSLLEYSFMKHLEKSGFNLDIDVSYESFRVPYEIEGRKRTYTIDFFVKNEKIVYEVKPYYALKTVINQSKFDAALLFFGERNIEFRVVSERDFQKITFSEAFQDLDIVWKEDTFRYFKRI